MHTTTSAETFKEKLSCPLGPATPDGNVSLARDAHARFPPCDHGVDISQLGQPLVLGLLDNLHFYSPPLLLIPTSPCSFCAGSGRAKARICSRPACGRLGVSSCKLRTLRPPLLPRQHSCVALDEKSCHSPSAPPPLVTPTTGVVSSTVVAFPPGRLAAVAAAAAAVGLGHKDGLVQRPLQGLLGVELDPRGGLPLPHLLGLDADVVDLLLVQ